MDFSGCRGVPADDNDSLSAPPIVTPDAEVGKPYVVPQPIAATSTGFSSWSAANSDLIFAILASKSINAA